VLWCLNSESIFSLRMDSVVAAVVEKFKQRSEFGQKKYGTNLDRKDLTVFEWANHMQEELMDAILYLEKLKRELSSSTPDQPFRS
jgi:hypothetical protein